MKNFRYFSFIILAIIFQSMSGIFGKCAALSVAPSIIAIVTNMFYILSLGCLGLQAIVWQQALRYFPLSVAYPCISITSFVVLFFAAILFNENVTHMNIIGLIIVTMGIYILFGGEQ